MDRYKLKCNRCGATCWMRGQYEGDTNATILDDRSLEEAEWEGGAEDKAATCEHSDFDFVDQEWDDPE